MKDKYNLRMTFKDIMKDVKVRKGTSAGVRGTKVHEDPLKYSRKDRRGSKKEIQRELDENQVLTNVRLSNHQKAVLSTIISRNNENTTIVDIVANVSEQNKQNMTNSINSLQKIGLVDTNPDNTLSVSDTGMQVMGENNLIDQGTGQLSPDGQQYLHMFSTDSNGKTQNDVDQQMDQVAPEQPPMSEPPFGESFTLLQRILEDIKFRRS